MKIRTITCGVNVGHADWASVIRRASQFLQRSRACLEREGYEVQSVRMSTQTWPGCRSGYGRARVVAQIKKWEQTAADHGITFTSIGTVRDPRSIHLIPGIIAGTVSVSASATIAGRRYGIDYGSVQAAAQAIVRISRTTAGGYGNFRFAAIANCPSDVPFYPAGYHEGPPCFSVGLECGDLIGRAFRGARSLPEAGRRLSRILIAEFGAVERICRRLSRDANFAFRGVDVSIAPSLVKRESLALAYEKLGLGRFGSAGTLAISALITDALRSVPIMTCGYRGLMLPILEDWGLARRFSSGHADIASFLAFSAVCGTGLDCVPLPGATSVKKIYALLLDVAALAVKLDKPLSARLLPVPGKTVGEKTDFKSPYLIDTKIRDIS